MRIEKLHIIFIQSYFMFIQIKKCLKLKKQDPVTEYKERQVLVISFSKEVGATG